MAGPPLHAQAYFSSVLVPQRRILPSRGRAPAMGQYRQAGTATGGSDGRSSPAPSGVPPVLSQGPEPGQQGQGRGVEGRQGSPPLEQSCLEKYGRSCFCVDSSGRGWEGCLRPHRGRRVGGCLHPGWLGSLCGVLSGRWDGGGPWRGPWAGAGVGGPPHSVGPLLAPQASWTEIGAGMGLGGWLGFSCNNKGKL